MAIKCDFYLALPKLSRGSMLLNLWSMLSRNVFVTIFQLQLWQKIRNSNLGRLLKHFIVGGVSSFFSTVTTRSRFYLYHHDRRALSQFFKYRNTSSWRFRYKSDGENSNLRTMEWMDTAEISRQFKFRIHITMDTITSVERRIYTCLCYIL
ncbi:hypothetical protein BDN70DRAFT_336603 [Pholiota conissans]|uniref:Uncharacterized protein n=1 Tax=Pholiota conissans TaxID=109636 RepID=A0A9P5YSY3_9AGAR|nr:hypothetical protein BDN70DRAFT_336603 [Pholiota conissans]